MIAKRTCPMRLCKLLCLQTHKRRGGEGSKNIRRECVSVCVFHFRGLDIVGCDVKFFFFFSFFSANHCEMTLCCAFWFFESSPWFNFYKAKKKKKTLNNIKVQYDRRFLTIRINILYSSKYIYTIIYHMKFNIKIWIP